MTPENPGIKNISWSCQNCDLTMEVPKAAKYTRCKTCGTLFRLRWRGGQIDGQFTAKLFPNFYDARLDEKELEKYMVNYKSEFQEVNNSIRHYEMSKGGERFRILSVFVIIASVIYMLFKLTVEGGTGLLNPGRNELIVAGLVGIALFVLAAFQLRKGAIIRKVNRLLKERKAIEREMMSAEAAGFLFAQMGKDKEAEKSAETEQTKANILEKFAIRKKTRRSRLSIKEDY